MLRSENPDFVVKEKKAKKVGLEDQLKRKSVDGKKGRGPAKKKKSAVSDIQEELPEAEDEEEPEEDEDSVEEEVSSPAPAPLICFVVVFFFLCAEVKIFEWKER